MKLKFITMKIIILFTSILVSSTLCHVQMNLSKDQKTIRFTGLDHKLSEAIKKGFQETYGFIRNNSSMTVS